MSASDIAKLLHNRQYRKETTPEILATAKAEGLVIDMGQSDDILGFCGAFEDEVGAYDGGVAYLDGNGLLQNPCDNDECPAFEKIRQTAPKVVAVWDKDGYSWVIESEIPHETFDIFDGEDKYCRGIVFALKDVRPSGAEPLNPEFGREQIVAELADIKTLINLPNGAHYASATDRIEALIRRLS